MLPAKGQTLRQTESEYLAEMARDAGGRFAWSDPTEVLMGFPVRHDPATGRFLGKDDPGSQAAPTVTEAKPLSPAAAEAHHLEWIDSLAPAEHRALVDYTQPPLASAINWGLRTGDATQPELVAAKLIDQALAKAPPLPYDVIAHRGVYGAFADHLRGMRPGDTFTERGFTSTDLQAIPPVAQKASLLALEIHVPRATRAAYVGHLSSNAAQERELLLGSGTTYRFDGLAGNTAQMTVVHQQAPIVLDAGPGRATVEGQAFAVDRTTDDRYAWGDPAAVQWNPSADLGVVVDGTAVPWVLVSWRPDQDPVAALTEHFHHAKWFGSDVADLVLQGLADTGLSFGPPAVLPAGLITELRLTGGAELTVPLRDPARKATKEDFEVRHDPATGRFLPKGDAGGQKAEPRMISSAEARGDSRPVSAAEFARLADRGRALLDGFEQSPPVGLDRRWDTIVSDSYAEVQRPWGGVTIEAHTGEPVQPVTDPDLYALTVKTAGQDSVTIPDRASPDQFAAAMREARTRFDPQLQRASHYLGVFHDDSHHRIDIDPVVIVRSADDVDAIGAYTHAIGGAYHFASGNGHFPPHVAQGSFAMADQADTERKTIAEFLAESRDPNRPLFVPDEAPAAD